MRRRSLLQMYHELRESGSASDFPNLLADTMYKKLLTRFNGWPSSWGQWCLKGDLADFKAHKRVILSEAPDLLEIVDDGNYTEAKFTDAGYNIKGKTFGRTFSVGRTAIINDDLNGILTMPNMFGRATVRTLVKAICTLLKGGVNAYDDAKLFALRTATTRNYIVDTALANTAAGMAAVVSCMQRIKSQVDSSTGEKLGLTPKFLLTGTTLFPIAEQLIKSTEIKPISTSGGGSFNSVKNLIPIEEPLLDDIVSATFWAVLADPQDCPVIEAGFLNNKETPDLLVQAPTMMRVAGGGSDPYDYEFDRLFYKVRHDWGLALGRYEGICRGHS